MEYMEYVTHIFKLYIIVLVLPNIILRKDYKINSVHILIVFGTEEILLFIFFFSCVTTGAFLKE